MADTGRRRMGTHKLMKKGDDGDGLRRYEDPLSHSDRLGLRSRIGAAEHHSDETVSSLFNRLYSGMKERANRCYEHVRSRNSPAFEFDLVHIIAFLASYCILEDSMEIPLPAVWELTRLRCT